MHLLSHLHGAVAGIVLCSLLFADEAGVPLPFAPSEVLLLFGGMLTQTGVLRLWVFFPFATIAMAAGMLTGYGWAHVVGQQGLERVAARIGARPAYRKVQARLTASGPVPIGVARLLPGIRPWATLVAGGADVDLSLFLTGALPALLLWEIIWLTLGVVVGVQAEHYMSLFERLLLRGAILVVLAVIGYSTVRRLRASGLLTETHVAIASPLAAVIGCGAIASATAGSLAIFRGTFHIRHNSLVDVLFVIAVLALSAAVAMYRKHPRLLHHPVPSQTD